MTKSKDYIKAITILAQVIDEQQQDIYYKSLTIELLEQKLAEAEATTDNNP